MIGNPSARPLRNSRGHPAGVHPKSEDSAQLGVSELKGLLDERSEELRRLSRRLFTIQDDERRHIARELHDSTGQKMVALLLDLAVLKRVEARLAPGARDLLTECFSLANQVCEEIRTLAYLMHPPMLDEFGLASALSFYIEGINKRKTLKVEFIKARVDRLPIEAELGLFRVAQAALTNVYLHSGRRKATVRMTQDAKNFIMQITDQGHGIPAGGDFQSAGVGLVGMKERMALVGGALEIDTGPRGTTVRAIVPLAMGRPSNKDGIAVPPYAHPRFAV
jgi:two-component system NarL family sensor kinase